MSDLNEKIRFLRSQKAFKNVFTGNFASYRKVSSVNYSTNSFFFIILRIRYLIKSMNFAGNDQMLLMFLPSRSYISI